MDCNRGNAGPTADGSKSSGVWNKRLRGKEGMRSRQYFKY